MRKARISSGVGCADVSCQSMSSSPHGSLNQKPFANCWCQQQCIADQVDNIFKCKCHVNELVELVPFLPFRCLLVPLLYKTNRVRSRKHIPHRFAEKCAKSSCARPRKRLVPPKCRVRQTAEPIRKTISAA